MYIKNIEFPFLTLFTICIYTTSSILGDRRCGYMNKKLQTNIQNMDVTSVLPTETSVSGFCKLAICFITGRQKAVGYMI